MNGFERLQTLFVMAGIGLAASQIAGVSALADRLILPILMVMLFATFASIPLEGLRWAFGNRRASWARVSRCASSGTHCSPRPRVVFLADQPVL